MGQNETWKISSEGIDHKMTPLKFGLDWFNTFEVNSNCDLKIIINTSCFSLTIKFRSKISPTHSNPSIFHSLTHTYLAQALMQAKYEKSNATNWQD